MDSSLILIPVLLMTIVPWVIFVFIIIFVFLKIFHVQLKGRHWIIIIIVALLIGSSVYFITQSNTDNKNFWRTQMEQIKKINFNLYEPMYVVPEFKLFENSVKDSTDDIVGGLQGASYLTYIYYNYNSPPDSRNTFSGRYSLIMQPLTNQVIITDSNDKLITSKGFENTTVSVIGTISYNEAQKVLSSLKKINANDIQFYSAAAAGY